MIRREVRTQAELDAAIAAAGVRYVACPVRLSEMAVKPDGRMPQKCKARRLAAPCWEVDRDGNPIAPAVVTWPVADPKDAP